MRAMIERVLIWVLEALSTPTKIVDIEERIKHHI
jgi:hypothetical protein